MMQSKIKGEGKPLVLVPGGLTGWVSWNPFVDSFATSRKVVQVQLLNVEYGLENKPLRSPTRKSLNFPEAMRRISFPKMNFLKLLIRYIAQSSKQCYNASIDIF